MSKMVPKARLEAKELSHLGVTSETMISQSSSPIPKKISTIISTSTSTSSNTSTPSTSSSDETAVETSKIIYWHGRGKKAVKALDRITLIVPRGKICAILGPSGSGKTTLIHCMVGLKKVSSGVVKINGTVPGAYNSSVPGRGVGYMPQEEGIFEELTTEETLLFFGRLYRMTSSEIKERMDFLLKFLDLPNRTRMVSTLSGGQRRRVSMAVALIHKPPLLILDEPTVGVDPVLRHNIWTYLVKLSKDGITTIITTHYIEEAVSANIVAFIREGRLLREGQPNFLMQEFKVDTLEKVFLLLCQNQEDDTKKTEDKLVSFQANGVSKPQQSDQNANEMKESNQAVPTPPKFTGFTLKRGDRCLDHFARVYALLLKNIIRQYRNWALFLFTLSIPAIEVALFFMCIGGDINHIPVIVAYPNETLSSELNGTQFGQIFLDKLNKSVLDLHRVDSREIAEKEARDGKFDAIITIDGNFSNALNARVKILEGKLSGNRTDDSQLDETLSQSTITLQPDWTEQFKTWTIFKEVNRAFELFTESLVEQKNIPHKIVKTPLQVLNYSFQEGSPRAAPINEWFVPGFLLFLLFICVIPPAAMTLVLEKKSGVLERILVAGVIPYEFIVSHLITITFILCIQIVIICVIVFNRYFYNIPCNGPLWLAILLIFMIGFLGIVYGLFLSAIFRDETSVFVLGMASMMPVMVLSGIIWPVSAMPKWLQYISRAFPHTSAIEALRYIMQRSWGFNHFEVALAFFTGSVWIAVLLAATAIIFTIKKAN